MSFLVLTTVPGKQDAQKLTEALLHTRLAACISVVPISSQYWWQGKKESAKEFLLFIKTEKRLFSRIEALFKKMHPHDTPELIGIDIAKIGKPYGAWLHTTLRLKAKR